MQHLVPEAGAAPARLTGADPASFAWGVIHRRHPRLVEQVRNANPYEPEHVAALERLAAEMSAEIRPLTGPPAPDSADWQRWSEPYLGRRWDEVPFLWAESFFYRRLLDAVGFFTPGPWYWLDPFAHLKTAELMDPTLDAELAELDWIADVDSARRAAALLMASLRGNRADLGFAAHAARFEVASGTSLVVDDSAALWAALDGGVGTVAVVADNAGRELLADLLLVDELLESGRAADVALHVKPTPYFVSDATPADVATGLRRLAGAGSWARAASRRLQDGFRSGRIRLRADRFWVAPLELDALPAELRAEFAGAGLTILKGDLNYRRLVGDRAWPATADVAAAAAHFPCPVAVLRTLKSEVALGVPGPRAAELDRQVPDWRFAGTRAMVQFVVP